MLFMSRMVSILSPKKSIFSLSQQTGSIQIYTKRQYGYICNYYFPVGLNTQMKEPERRLCVSKSNNRLVTKKGTVHVK